MILINPTNESYGFFRGVIRIYSDNDICTNTICNLLKYSYKCTCNM